MRASIRRIWGMMYRHLTLYRRSWPRLVELAYWPVLQMCIWGFTSSFLRARMGNPAIMAGATLLGGVLPALLATTIAVLLSDYFFIAPLHTLRVTNLVDVVAQSAQGLRLGRSRAL